MSFKAVTARCVALAAFLFFLSAHQSLATQFYNDWATNHFSDLPSQAGWTNDPDRDGEINLVEFAFGTDPRVPDGLGGAMTPQFGSASGTNGTFVVQILERNGHQPGVQIDLYLSKNLTDWIRPWWFRMVTNSLSGDPVGSVRESFTTQITGTNIWYVRSAVTLIEAGPEVATYYVATNGSDSNNGITINTPFATLGKAAGLANPGNLIYALDGYYICSNQVTLSRSGSPTNPIRLRAYPGTHPAFDFTLESSSSAGIRIQGDCWQVYGLEVIHSGHNGILINGNSNIVERCVIHESGDTGLHITSNGGTQLGGFNLVLNCDSYRNFDLAGNGGNADGFTAKFIVGQSNIFRGCRSWNNSDDGWDFWRATNSILVDHCMTFSNGFNVFGAATFAGDGNGFKMGGDYQAGRHHYINCVSFGNRVNGYDQNNNTAGLVVDNCTSFNNGGANFAMNHDSTNAPMVGVHVVRNTLSIAGHSADAFRTGALLTNNSWQVVSPAPTSAELLSIAGAYAMGARRDDGSLPETPFLRPIPGNRLVNRGTNIGNTFFGAAPDLGAYETPEW